MSGIAKKVIVVALPVILIGGLIGWRFSVKNAQNAKAMGAGGGAPGGAQGQARGGAGGARRGGGSIELATAGPADLDQTLDAVGGIEAPYNVNISPKTAGRIDFLEVREGAAVKTGQVLVKIDPAEIEGQVLQQQAAVAEARSRLAQAQLTQGSTNVGITSTIDQQRANLASVQADYNQVRENYGAQVATAHSAVTDADAKIAAAQSQVANAKASLQSAQANLANAKTKYDRVYSLYKQGFIAAQDVDDARTTVDVMQANVNVASGQIDAANSALRSAQAAQSSAVSNEKIVTRKGLSDIAAAKAKVAQAAAQLTAASANRSQGPAYAANLNALQSSVAAAEAQLRQAEARRSDTVLTSPIDGVVSLRSTDPGAIASPGSPVLTIQFLKWVYVTGSIPIENTEKVKVGTPVTFTIDAIPGKTFSASVAEVNPAADPQNRQFTIRIKVDNAANALKPGMYARLHVVLQRDEAAVAVPREAVKVAKDGSKSVFVVDDKMVAHMTPVTTGGEDPKSIEITSGLKVGDKVVVLSYSPVRDGQTVTTGKREGKGGAGGEGAGSGKRRPAGGSAQ